MRCGENFSFHQSPNIQWFSDLLRPFLEELGLHVDVIGLDRGEFPFKAFYETVYGAADATAVGKWAALYEGELSGGVSDWLRDAFGDAMVFLFEASPAILGLLRRSGQVYLNFRVHPLRFGSDLVFAIETNDRDIGRRLRSFAVGARFIREEVGRARRRWHGAPAMFPDNAMMFLAQTRDDSSLIYNGKFLSIDANIKKIFRISDGKIPFHKRHPLDPNEAEIDKWLKIFPHSIPVENDVSVYQIFAAHPPMDFITISSGSGYEAGLFGHRTHFVSPRNWTHEDGGFSHFVKILYEYWHVAFWDHILFGSKISSLPPGSWITARAIRRECAFIPDRLRRTINFEWSPR
ncbi:hypothetical protein AA12717_2746 [Gluconacetobacter sacchari DSM 12717]|nr:hypothetical protein AA12717_2746 [Gluconacetobacter sacchari DSM 12717]